MRDMKGSDQPDSTAQDERMVKRKSFPFMSLMFLLSDLWEG